MASVRYIILAACQRAGLMAQAGFENEAAAWIRKQGSVPCAYVGYRRGIGVAGYDNVSVVFGGNDARASLRRVRDELEKSLGFRSESETTIEGNPALVMTARTKKRVYGFGGAASPIPPTPTVDYMYFEAVEPNSTVALVSTLETAPNLEYSTDGVNWQEWQHTTADDAHTFDTLTLTAVGDRVYLRGDNPNGLAALPEGSGEDPDASNFRLTGTVKGGGNIMSLLDVNMKLTEVPMLGFFMLFSVFDGGESALITAPSMETITTISNGGCASMYNGCTSLTVAADMLSLTTISNGGCSLMYAACSSLTAAADMPALTTIGDGGCPGMYYGCTFDMSDDGTTLNFDFPTPPVTTTGSTPETYATAYNVAYWMGNTTGFTNP